MHEMNNLTIKRYFQFLRHTMAAENLFYCCNRKSKTLPDGELLEFANYPWSNADRFLVDEDCPWNQHRLSVTPASRDPSVLGVKVPILQYYAGPIKHRLTILALETADRSKTKPITALLTTDSSGNAGISA